MDFSCYSTVLSKLPFEMRLSNPQPPRLNVDYCSVPLVPLPNASSLRLVPQGAASQGAAPFKKLFRRKTQSAYDVRKWSLKKKILSIQRGRSFSNLDDCELHTSVDSSFIQMEEDFDRQRLLGGQLPYTQVDPQTASMTSDLQKKERYDRVLRRAKTEDLGEISGIGCLYQCGVDKCGRPVIVFIGKWFKFEEINLDKALLYLIHLLEPLVQSDYVIIYFHTITNTENHPSMAWIRQVYEVLQYKHKKHLKNFYIVHPTIWTKLMTWWFTTFMAPQIKHKVHSLSGIEYLYDFIDRDQLEIPAYIIEHDMTINGMHYYRPGSS